jgi:indole-3-glycerol phosphate synthase
LLRKDFIIDALQIYEAAAYGADAVLLIAVMMDDRQLKELRAAAEELSLTALVEVHDEAELERAVKSGAKIIGINNRNLKTFEVDLKTTERLTALVGRVTSRGESDSQSNNAASVTRPTIVAESGINTRADVERVAKAGVNAILVGESLMRSGDIAAKVKELIRE